ncbi:putative N-acetyltransferase YhbS [Paenibacillus shirakamiensis]|uniref:N-acetyltransferase YhbS n=1 Tax=Paenibacillus shirakamiensis TaxID=1265935 RepID=A0ABS4JEG2_9BACL|nr:GNAT family N-acetyltransferase [Paenibacillus shirakamiensis]MBP2000103.1 putative N-acetyltransferase YhbS [Paenibacillus shirakamiensis]
MRIENVMEYDLTPALSAEIQELLNFSFPDVYPKTRNYFKQLPHLRILAFNEEDYLIGHLGLDYRIMNLDGEPVTVVGIVDLCVSQSIRSRGIGSSLLREVDKFCLGRNIDFVLLFADCKEVYLRNGYKPSRNTCTWMKIDTELQRTRGIGQEVMEELMIKEVGNKHWSEADLDLLGYLY